MGTNYFASLVEQLQAKGIGFEDGLSNTEVEAIQHQHGFIFPPDLRLLLQTALPVSMPPDPARTHPHPFPNWRSGDETDLRYRLDWPYEGICFDIRKNGFRMESWGPRPESDEAACAIAREKLDQAPKLIPIYSHRFIPDSPHEAGNPVYLVWQTDIVYYGFDLPSYLANEFKIGNPYGQPEEPRRIEFWAALPFIWREEWN